eukprot:3167712-Alexandrium_andersonii.AAC.2
MGCHVVVACHWLLARGVVKQAGDLRETELACIRAPAPGISNSNYTIAFMLDPVPEDVPQLS